MVDCGVRARVCVQLTDVRPAPPVRFFFARLMEPGSSPLKGWRRRRGTAEGGGPNVRRWLHG
jgi:hypothetical protein